METLKALLEQYLKVDCDWQLDDEFETNRKIDVYGSSNWTAPDEKTYKEYEDKINNYKIDNDLFTLSCWCDISGYDYWVVKQEEGNYVSIDVILKKDSYTVAELIEIRDAIIKADLYFLRELEQAKIDY